ncbi:MAG: hypothetical protein HFE90_09420 [Firmicutes bacterium]|nr:hypothetical protein [Bacillota bacterium]
MDNYLKNKISGIKNSDILLFNKLKQFHNFYEKKLPDSFEENSLKKENDEQAHISDKYFSNIKSPTNLSFSYTRFLEIKKEANSNQSDRLKKLFPKSLLYIGILTIPALLLYSLGFYRTSYSPSAGRAIQIIALIVPLIFWGPLHMGYLSGVLNEIRTGRFNQNSFTNTLFFAFNDKYFIKSILTFLIVLAAVLVPLLPAVILSSFSNNLFFNVINAGFAYIATKILCTILWITGIIGSIHIWLRLSLTFPLIIDNFNINPINAVKLSFKAMKNNCLTLFILILSYAHWYLLTLGIAILIILIIGASIYTYIQTILDPVTSYMYLIYSILAIYIISCIIFTFAISVIAARPTIGLVTFYNKLFAEKSNEISDITNITDLSEIIDLPDLSDISSPPTKLTSKTPAITNSESLQNTADNDTIQNKDHESL